MAVYVDDVRWCPNGPIECHLLADSPAEMGALFERLGLKAGGCSCAENLAIAKRPLAVYLGAVQVSSAELAAMSMHRCVEGRSAPPAGALRWYEVHRRDLVARCISAD